MVVRRLGDHLFVTRRGWIPQIKALWFLVTRYPVLFILVIETSIRILANPGTLALFLVVEGLPEWKRTHAEHKAN